MINSQRKQRTAVGLSAIVALGLVLGACGSDEAPETSGGAATTWEGIDDGATITLWSRSSTETQAKNLVEAYNATHENQVELTIVPVDDFQTKVGAAAGSGGLPDLLSADIVYAPNYTSEDIFLDITDRIDALPFAAGISPAHIETGSWDGKSYLLPFNQDVSVVFWNKDLFEQAGLDPEKAPATLEEFAASARAVADLDGVDGTYFGGNCGGCLAFTWWPSIWADGGQVISEDGNTATLDSPEALAVYDVYKELVDDGATGAGTKEETGATWVAPFLEGKVGIQTYPSTQLGAALDAGIDVGVGPIPGVKGGESTFVGGDGIGITASTNVSDQAWNFLAWSLSDDTQLNVVAENGDLISRADLAEKAYTDPRVQVAAAVAGQGHTPFALNYGAAINDPTTGAWTPLFRDAVFGDGSEVTELNGKITAALQGN